MNKAENVSINSEREITALLASGRRGNRPLRFET